MKSNEFLRESKNKAFIKQHIQWVADQVGIDELPKIVLLDKPVDTTFGQYDPEEKTIKLVIGDRHPVDVLRTLAHELRHHKQNLEGDLTDGAGDTGTDQENDANSTAGIVLRDFAKENPQYFGLNKEEPIDEASYEGNIGVMEMMKFFQIADDTQKDVLKALIKSGNKEKAWDLIQKVTGIALHAISEGSECSDGSVILTEKWVHLGKFGNGWTWGIGDHFMERWHQPERNCPWAYIERIIKRLPFVKPKLEQMLNFPQFYLRDSKTGVELGCKISTFGQPETKLVYINTIVIKPSERKGAQSPIIIVN